MLKLAAGTLLSRSQICEAIGASKHLFDTWVGAGMPMESRATGRGGMTTAHLGRVVSWLVAHYARLGEQIDGERERALLFRQQRLRAEHENAVATGEYVRAKDVEAADAVIFTAIRDRVLQVTSVVPVLRDLALEGDMIAMSRVLDEALREALESATNRVQGAIAR